MDHCFTYSEAMNIYPAYASRISARGIAGQNLRITEMAISEIQVSTVTIDGGTFFPALLLPGEWNGHAVPVFTRETVEAIADFHREAWSRNGGGSVTYNLTEDSYTFVSEEGSETFDSCTIGGRSFYGIGAGSWSWSVLTEEEYAEAVELFGETFVELSALQDFLMEAIHAEAIEEATAELYKEFRARVVAERKPTR